MISLAKRVIKQIIGDRKTVALLVVAPLFIMTLMSMLLGNTHIKPTIAYYDNSLPNTVISALSQMDNTLIVIQDHVDAKTYLKQQKTVDAVLSVDGASITITVYEQSSKSTAAIQDLQEALKVLNPQASIHTDLVYGDSGQSTFDAMGHIFLGLIIFFLIFLVSSMALVHESVSGTLERMLMTPIKRFEVVGGYTLGFGVFAVLQAIGLVLFGVYFLGIPSSGAVYWVIVIMVLLAIVSVELGEMVSIFTSNELQVVQMVPILIYPQIFLSGLIPIDTIPNHLGVLAYISPVYYGCTAIKAVMVYGNGLDAIGIYILALTGFILVLAFINTKALKKYRRL